jgi:hypothetical protein
MEKFLQDLQDSRYFTFLFVSVWKIACFFCIMLVVTDSHLGPLGVGNPFNVEGNLNFEDLFNFFSAAFSPRIINVTEVRMTFPDVGGK